MNSAKRPSVVFNLTCNNIEKGDDHETVDTVISVPHHHPRASIFSNISNGLAVFVYLVIIMLPKFEHDEDMFQLFKI